MFVFTLLVYITIDSFVLIPLYGSHLAKTCERDCSGCGLWSCNRYDKELVSIKGASATKHNLRHMLIMSFNSMLLLVVLMLIESLVQKIVS